MSLDCVDVGPDFGEAFFGRILEDSLNEIYIFDAETYRFIQVNKGALTNIGYSMEEMRGKTAYDIKPQFSRKTFIGAIEPLRTGEERFLTFEAEHERKNGTCYPVEVRLQLFVDEEQPLFVAIIADISERKEAEAVKNRLGRILEESLNEIYVFDAETYHFIQVNKGALTNIGYSMEEMRGKTAYDIKPQFSRETFIEAVEPLKTGEKRFLTFEAKHERKDGTCYPVEVRLQLFSDEDPPVFVAIINDITERKRAQEILRENEARFSATFNQAAIGIAHVSMSSSLMTANNKFYEILGYEGGEILEENFRQLIFGVDQDSDMDEIARLLDMEIDHVTSEKRFVKKDGSIVWATLTASIVRDENDIPKYFISLIQDITKRKNYENDIQRLNEELEQRVFDRTAELESANWTLEEALVTLKRTQTQLIESEKMASLGGLVAGVAHEINTPVGIGVTASTHLAEVVKTLDVAFQKGDMKRSDLEVFIETANQSSGIILSNLRRASDLIRSFKQVSADQSSEDMRQVNVREYLEEITLSLRPNLKKNKHVIDIDCDDAIEIETYPGALSQIVTNLVMNSVTHGFEDRDNGHIGINVSKPNGNLVIDFSDDGKGIPESEKDKIFDPFFTTKRGKGGTGLGLHILYNLVTQKLKGQVSCKSIQGSGAHFTITIPTTAGAQL